MNPWAEYLCPRVDFHERILWARAPGTEQRREILSIDISVVIDVGRSSGSPLTQDHSQIRSVNLMIAVDVSSACYDWRKIDSGDGVDGIDGVASLENQLTARIDATIDSIASHACAADEGELVTSRSREIGITTLCDHTQTTRRIPSTYRSIVRCSKVETIREHHDS